MKYRKDYTRDFELILLEVTKRLQQSTSVEEYYESSKLPILEHLNPNNSYKYVTKKQGSNFKWVVKVDNDPAFVVALNLKNSDYYVLDFYYIKIDSEGNPVQVFDRNKDEPGLEGIYYLDTLCKIVLDEILPIFQKSKINLLYFTAYNKDGSGEQRASIFNAIISKFKLKEKFNIKIEGLEFKIYKK